MIGDVMKGATTAMPTPPPPLPELGDLVERSEWLRGRPGLEGEVRRWQSSLGAERDRIAGEARELATPRLRRIPFGALFLLCIRFLWFSLAGLIGRFAARRRNPSGASGSFEGAAVRRSKHLVQAGGPAYVKLGQLIATARGALPDPWTEAFAWCRDEVPALKDGVAEGVIDRELGHRRAETFTSIDPHPVAAASIAQVHLARLADGTEVAVKVQRPGLRARFEADIRALSVIAVVADRLSQRARIANLPGFVELFAQLVLEELDFRLEAMNMTEIGLANEDAGLDHIRIPRPIPGLVTARVLVMERVPGIRYTDAAAAHPDLDGQRIVRLAVQGVLEHALLYGVFHGDLHAGNVLIDEAGNFSLVDFGIAGRLDASQRAALCRLVIGFARNDFAAQVAAVAELGALPPGIDLAPLVRQFAEESTVLLAAVDRPLSQLDFGSLTAQVSRAIRLLAEHRFRQPKELVLFSKNLLYLNGLCNAFAPDINLLSEIAPVFLYFQTKYPQEIAQILMGSFLPPA
ncbi:MAG TPA: AarF/UbiB family protein [Acidimicrobiia bacterium]|nr:AarF/UbiB family protein [Acidimicrobiia bacterium]